MFSNEVSIVPPSMPHVLSFGMLASYQVHSVLLNVRGCQCIQNVRSLLDVDGRMYGGC
jgi:hypothetical protein